MLEGRPIRKTQRTSWRLKLEPDESHAERAYRWTIQPAEVWGKEKEESRSHQQTFYNTFKVQSIGFFSKTTFVPLQEKQQSNQKKMEALPCST